MALQIAKGLCGRNFSKQINILQNIPKITNVNARCVVMRTEKAQPAPLESHDERNMRLNRPQSPHLTIYQPQLTSFLSITHRMTGIALTGYAVVLGLGALVMPHDFAHYATMIEGLQLSAPCLMSIKFVLAYPFAYHMVNGVRHLAWDAAKFLTIKEVYSTGYAMLAVATVFAGILAAL
uniref:Putative succinate dehydrogenase cytochrome b subunit n=1 Tax=Xenopsylla cheopis TaxID=163159 RepID=A0A6M2DEE4_XENCH